MIRFAAAALCLSLAACAGSADPVSTAEVQCRNYAQRSAMDDYRSETSARIAAGMDLSPWSPMEFEDIRKRECD